MFPDRSKKSRSTAPTQIKPKEVALELCLGNNKECMFCGHKEISDLLYGKLYLLFDVVVHYYCLVSAVFSYQYFYFNFKYINYI